MARAHALVPAAGAGDRTRSPVNKVLVLIDGIPMIAHTLLALERAPSIVGIVVVGRVEECDALRMMAADYRIEKLSAVVAGGATRADSVRNGLLAIPKEAEIIAIHDAARPFVTVDIIEESIRLAAEKSAAVAAVPIVDTIKRARQDKRVECTLDRDVLWAVQTPQTFRASLIRRAYGLVKGRESTPTDDSSVVELLGEPVYLFMGSYENLKITTPFDFKVAEQLAQARRRDGTR